MTTHNKHRNPSWWYMLLVRLFGKKHTAYNSNGLKVTIKRFRGKSYVIKYSKP